VQSTKRSLLAGIFVRANRYQTQFITPPAAHHRNSTTTKQKRTHRKAIKHKYDVALSFSSFMILTIMPFQIRVCPFSVAVFLGTAAMITMQLRKKKSSTENAQTSTDTSSTRPSLPLCEVVFVLGGPGAGKGTQCQLIQERMLGWAHLSAGDLLRAERQAGGELGDLINAKIASGALVPSSITVRLLENAMAKECSAKTNVTKFLIDGFPRSFENMEAWQDTMSHHKVKFVLNFECPEEVLVGRLLERGQTSGRTDDSIDVIRKRFQTHQMECMPIVEYYETHNTAIYKIASDQGIEQVYAQVAAIFEKC
jgi:UMP-CMP kinase